MAYGEDLSYITATEALAAFRARKLSPVELMRAVIARSEAVNPKVNAYADTYYDRALAAARKAERAYARGGDRLRPLEGVPIVIKDFHQVKGERTTGGSYIYQNHVSDHSAPTVERLLGAGAIMFARTTTPELAYAPHTHSALWGISRNPWNLDYTPGGSSGGAGAAVAAGMTTLADGSDGGGSIRIPSSTCGIFGYKPPFGRNPTDHTVARESLIHFGPMTRSVGDAALMQNVMAGPHPDDACSLRPKLEIPARLERIKGWKIAFSMNLGYYEVDEEVQKNTREALKVFKGLGCKVEEVDLGWNFGTLDTWLTLWEGAFWAMSGHLYPRWRFEMDGFVRELLERGQRMSAERYYKAQLARGEMYRALGALFERYDLLATPTTAAPGLPANHDVERTDFRINGKPLTVSNRPGDIYVQWQLCYPFNLMAECPAATVPSGFSKAGLPTGLQLVGRTYDDVSVFRAAADYERARPWRQVKPSI